LQRLARKTDGVFTVAPEAGISPEWMLRTYAGMVHRYEVSYPLNGPGESKLAITIFPRCASPTRNTG
jgi:hypothetical protein